MATVISTVNDNQLLLGPDETARLEKGKVFTAVQSSPPGVEVKALIRCAPEQMLALLTNYQKMPQHIFGLERAEVLRSLGDTAIVRFTMKLPFPVGRIVWTNVIQTRTVGGVTSLEWTLRGGDLEINDGRLVMMAHRGDSNLTYANYAVRVQSRSGLPKSAERLATRWLLPKIVGKLRRIAEQG